MSITNLINQDMINSVKPDYDFWGKMDSWSVSEAIYLILNICPTLWHEWDVLDSHDFPVMRRPPFSVRGYKITKENKKEFREFVEQKDSKHYEIAQLVLRSWRAGDTRLKSMEPLSEKQKIEFFKGNYCHSFKIGVFVSPPHFLDWASEKGFDIPEGLMSMLNKSNKEVTANIPYMNSDHVYFSEELEMGVSAWMHFFENGNFITRKGPKDPIRRWLKEHYPKASLTAIERVTTIVNPNKKGGAPSVD